MDRFEIIMLIILVIFILLLVVIVGALTASQIDACQAFDWEHYRGSLCIDSDGYVRKP